MTPQQKKADELVWKFMDKVDVYPMEVRKQSAIQCAIICVEEILVVVESDESATIVELQYWQSVLNEFKSRL
jgi:hypothetical protein